MPIVAKDEKTYEPIPLGVQQAVCSGVFDIGTHEGEYQGKPTLKHQIVVIWELDERKTLGDFAGQPHQISKFYTLSLGEKANLRKDLESWRGQPFTAQELEGFDLENLIGANCLLNIVDKEKGGQKIAAIMPLAKNMAKIKQTMSGEPEWVAKFRSKSVEALGAGKSAPAGAAGAAQPQPEDDLPF
jgi:hypothetical protein